MAWKHRHPPVWTTLRVVRTMTSMQASAAPVVDAPSQPLPAHAMTIDDVVRVHGTHAEKGLSGTEAAARLARYGRNELAQAPPEPWWRRLGRQFADLLIWI